MSGLADWLRRLRGGKPIELPSSEPAPAEPASGAPHELHRDEIAAIRDVVPSDPQSVAAATAALRRLRGTPHEGSAIAAAVAAQRAGRTAAPLAIMAADVLVQRGEVDLSRALLAELDDPAALLLSADIRAGAGELEAALGFVDRVLARDIAVPGARERGERWRALLGREPAPVQDASATLLEPALARVPLRIVGEAGRGGAGVVYEALDERLGRRVALKVYHQPERDLEKIEREARVAVAFTGAGVVRVFDVDASAGWIAMEWLDGGSLKRRIDLRELGLLLPIQQWFVPLARTLARVHAGGYVHADVKPANVLFRSTAEPVLSDFGLARETGAPSTDGSVGFMSPERLAQRPLAPSDDVYALGRVLDAVLEITDPAEGPWHAIAERAQASNRPSDVGQLLRSSGLSL